MSDFKIVNRGAGSNVEWEVVPTFGGGDREGPILVLKRYGGRRDGGAECQVRRSIMYCGAAPLRALRTNKGFQSILYLTGSQ